MKEVLDKVKEWNKTAAVPERDIPGFPDNSRIDLRMGLLEEELSELEVAAYNRDIVGVLDALCDIQYLLAGAVRDFGMQDIFEEAFNEVHSSNMSKFLDTTQHARESVNKLLEKGVEANYKLSGKRFVIRRNSDDKILKGMFFFEPRLKSIIKDFKAKMRNEGK